MTTPAPKQQWLITEEQARTGILALLDALGNEPEPSIEKWTKLILSHATKVEPTAQSHEFHNEACGCTPPAPVTFIPESAVSPVPAMSAREWLIGGGEGFEGGEDGIRACTMTAEHAIELMDQYHAAMSGAGVEGALSAREFYWSQRWKIGIAIPTAELEKVFKFAESFAALSGEGGTK